jgi:glycosyltransferase involved in cell wall biosynthesis
MIKKGLVSVVIPSRNEKYLQKTILDLLKKAEEEIEITAVLDGYWPPKEEIVQDKRVKYIHFSNARGMRECINAAVRVSQGEFILKTDAHCMFSAAYDVELKLSCKSDYVVIPRRYRLDPEKWELKEVNKPPVDYMYLSYPDNPGDWGGAGLHGRVWDDRNRRSDIKDIYIDDLMSFQGSFWFMRRKYFDWLELMDVENYGDFAQEAQEIGLKCWLSGGRVIVNKRCWYAHWHKGKEDGRGYRLEKKQLYKGNEYTNTWMSGKVWDKQIHSIEWLIEKFRPVPGWPESSL